MKPSEPCLLPPVPDDPRVARALEEYLAALEAGQAPARDQFLKDHAEIAGLLAEGLDGLEFIRGAAANAHHIQEPPLLGTAPDIQSELPLGDYRIIREVGRGGMGVVYEAM